MHFVGNGHDARRLLVVVPDERRTRVYHNSIAGVYVDRALAFPRLFVHVPPHGRSYAYAHVTIILLSKSPVKFKM